MVPDHLAQDLRPSAMISRGGGVIMKTHALVFRSLTSYPYNAGTELWQAFAAQAAFHKADTN